MGRDLHSDQLELSLTIALEGGGVVLVEVVKSKHPCNRSAHTLSPDIIHSAQHAHRFGEAVVQASVV